MSLSFKYNSNKRTLKHIHVALKDFKQEQFDDIQIYFVFIVVEYDRSDILLNIYDDIWHDFAKCFQVPDENSFLQ